MKRYGNIITPEKITMNFVKKCILDASKGKRHRNDVCCILANLDFYTLQLLNLVLSGQFVPSPYRFMQRTERGKTRDICIPTFYPDQCMHHVLIDSILDILMKRIDPYACVSIPGRGIDFGVRALEKWIQREDPHKTKWFFKGDIQKCFDSLRSDIIMRELTTVIKDPLWLQLMQSVLYNHPTLPIGLYVSAWLLNLILKPLDEAIRRFDGTHRYIRYMDDICVFGPNKRKLQFLVTEIVQPMLWDRFGLLLKDDYIIGNLKAHGIKDPTSYVDMLGFEFHRDVTLLRQRNYDNLIQLVECIRMDKYILKQDTMNIEQARSLVALTSGLHYIYNHDIMEGLLEGGRLLTEAKIVISNYDRSTQIEQQQEFKELQLTERLDNLVIQNDAYNNQNRN